MLLFVERGRDTLERRVGENNLLGIILPVVDDDVDVERTRGVNDDGTNASTMLDDDDG